MARTAYNNTPRNWADLSEVTLSRAWPLDTPPSTKDIQDIERLCRAKAHADFVNIQRGGTPHFFKFTKRSELKKRKRPLPKTDDDTEDPSMEDHAKTIPDTIVTVITRMTWCE